jgi:hypothetical protein
LYREVRQSIIPKCLSFRVPPHLYFHRRRCIEK